MSRDIGLRAEPLRKRVRQAEADQGLRPHLPTSEEIEQLRKEVFELRRANEILAAASGWRGLAPWFLGGESFMAIEVEAENVDVAWFLG
jgi:hypothetical protein